MNDIEQYLRDNKPEMPDEGYFLMETNARLSTVEGIKDTVSAERRRGRMALIIALAAGLVLGCAVTLLILLYPAGSGQAGSLHMDKLIESLQAWKNVFLVLIPACAIALAIIFLKRSPEAV